MLSKTHLSAVYPRSVYIVIVENKNDLKKIADTYTAYRIIKGMNAERDQKDFLETLENHFNDDTLAACYPVLNKESNALGVLCVIFKPDYVNCSTLAHESVHMADYFFESLGMNGEDFTDGDEPYAYLVGWIFQGLEEVYESYRKKNNNGKQEVR